jgi:uncharacterized protein YcfJ
MNLILYTNICPCAIKSAQFVKSFARENGYEFTSKRCTYNEVYAQEAKSIGGDIPFIYNDINKRTISAKQVSKESLIWLTA